MKRKTYWLAISTLAAVTLLTSACGFKPPLHGAVIDPATPAAEINLADQNGNPFQMSNLHGKVVLLFFGFVYCTDECPLTLAHFKLAFQALGDGSKDVQVVMVSTDPARDTPQAMKSYLESFNPSFIGIPGKPADLAKIWKDYGVTVMDGGETHSSFIYVIDRKGALRETFLPDLSPDDIVADLKVFLAEK